jgi:hypothetical protein
MGLEPRVYQKELMFDKELVRSFQHMWEYVNADVRCHAVKISEHNQVAILFSWGQSDKAILKYIYDNTDNELYCLTDILSREPYYSCRRKFLFGGNKMQIVGGKDFNNNERGKKHD